MPTRPTRPTSSISQLGLEHVLWFTSDESPVAAPKPPSPPCAWYSFPFRLGVHSQRKLLTKLLMLAARVTALGYNQLALDSDIHPHAGEIRGPPPYPSPDALLPPLAALAVQDPYRFLKAPPFAGLNLIMMRGGRSGISNTGAFYIQAA